MSGSGLDWSKLSPADRRKHWQRLVTWVRWLTEAYEPWVKLPDCWPLHESLRHELASLQAWHEEILESGSGSDGVLWHASLRAAAGEWRALAQCRHEERPWQSQGA